MENELFAPYERVRTSVSIIMRDVIIAILPSIIFGCVVFGFRAALLVLTCVLTCVLTELLFCAAAHRQNGAEDLSAVVTGLVLAMNLSPACPIPLAAAGSVFAIAIVKQAFGGLGKNIFNPAMAAKCVMLLFALKYMNVYYEPLAETGTAVSNAYDPLRMLVGLAQGSIGTTSPICLVLGGIYLTVRRDISPYIPISYIAAFGLMVFFFGNNGKTDIWLYTFGRIINTGVLAGAIFAATDPVTSPSGKTVIYGACCGVLSFVINRFILAEYAVCLAITAANLAVAAVDIFAGRKSWQRSGKGVRFRA